jgi:hypothetical protein
VKDYELGQLTFYDAPRSQYSSGGPRIPVTIDGFTLDVQGSFEGIPASSRSIPGTKWVSNPGFVKEHRLVGRVCAIKYIRGRITPDSIRKPIMRVD